MGVFVRVHVSCDLFLQFFTKTTNKNIIMSSFKSSGDIQKKEGGPDSCSDNQSSSVTLNELANKATRPQKEIFKQSLIYSGPIIWNNLSGSLKI